MRSAALCLVALAACAPEEAEEIDIAREGPVLYAEYCAACHGPGGRGDGPLAASLDARPADLTTLGARAGGYDYAAVMSAIDGYRLGPRSMPQFGAVFGEARQIPFDSGDGVLTPTPVPLVAIATHIATLQRPGR